MSSAIEFEELAKERQAALDEVARLQAALEPAVARLKDLDAVLDGLRRLGLLREEPKDDRSDLEKMLDDLDLESTSQAPIKRIRSTSLVAKLVNSSEGPLTIDEVMAEFDERYGFPKTWANPRNAIGNALRRAADKKMIDRHGADMFERRTIRRADSDG